MMAYRMSHYNLISYPSQTHNLLLSRVLGGNNSKSFIKPKDKLLLVLAIDYYQLWIMHSSLEKTMALGSKHSINVPAEP